MKKPECKISKCKAKCCGPVPFDADIIKKHKSEINKGATVEAVNDIVFCFDVKSYNCGFLTTDKKCKIYDERPSVCHLFGDPRQKNPLLKCQYLGQIGTMEQELALKDSIDRISP